MPATDFHISQFATLPPSIREKILRQLTDDEAEALLHDWRFVARPEQLAPPGDWRTWLYKAGRGSGKTRSGAEWVREQVRAGYGRMALIAPTAADARDVMIEGESGILEVCWAGDRTLNGAPLGRPHYQPSMRRLTWENGAQAVAFSAEEPERLRGPQHDGGWCDEVGAWAYPQETWDMFQFGLRIGRDPRCLVTTTPKPIPLIRAMIKDPTTVMSEGSTMRNAANLAPQFLQRIKARYEGTRLGRQEMHGELLEDVPGALWTTEMIDKAQRDPMGRRWPIPDMQRVVVGVDPSGTKGQQDGYDFEEGDDIGIIVGGKGVDGLGYILGDFSCNLSPDGWGRRVVDAYNLHQADRVVAEINYGGAMVEAIIRAVDRNVSYSSVSASRGKVVRAEPVAALYEQGRVKHVTEDPKELELLEDQMKAMTSSGYVGDGSPDRVDAKVWVLTELMLEEYGEATAVKVRFGGR